MTGTGDHRANIRWRARGDFASGRYARAHEWRFDGGAVVPASASPGIVPPPASDPAGVDPEEALVASVGACHMLWFLDLARADGLDVATYEDDAVGAMGRNADGRLAMLSIVLRPRIAFVGVSPDAARVARLHDAANAHCFIANSLKTAITVEPEARS